MQPCWTLRKRRRRTNHKTNEEPYFYHLLYYLAFLHLISNGVYLHNYMDGACILSHDLMMQRATGPKEFVQ
jgi:hypothetical protein